MKVHLISIPAAGELAMGWCGKPWERGEKALICKLYS